MYFDYDTAVRPERGDVLRLRHGCPTRKKGCTSTATRLSDQKEGMYFDCDTVQQRQSTDETTGC